MYQNFIFLYLYETQHVSGDTPPILMMDDVSPETRWASYKYKVIKFWYILASCWIFLYEFYYNARIHEHHVHLWDSNLTLKGDC
jgi:hypothetical protein